jgi:hypothetical protein
MDVASILSAGAASIAAVLSGIGLYVSGQREEARWMRETLLEAFEGFLNASFETTSTAKYLGGFRGTGTPIDRDEAVKRIRSLHEAQLDSLTRLRLLADANVIHAAADVHDGDYGFVQMMTRDPRPTEEEYQAAVSEAHRRRETFLATTRQALRVSGKVAAVGNLPPWSAR